LGVRSQFRLASLLIGKFFVLNWDPTPNQLCHLAIQDNNLSSERQQGLGVRSQFRTTLFPAKDGKERNWALTPKPLLPEKKKPFLPEKNLCREQVLAPGR
jgi:hypothetical protein